MPSGELAYLFRHAITREAAYGLQLPSARASAHWLALQVLEDLLGENTAPFAAELLAHVRAAAQGATTNATELAQREHRYLWQAAVHAHRAYDIRGALRLFQEYCALPHLQGAERVDALRHLGAMLCGVGKPAEAETPLRQSAQIAAQAGDAQLAVTAQCNLANALIMLGKHAEAEQLLREALDTARARGMSRSVSTASGNLSLLLKMLRRLDEAEALCHIAIEADPDSLDSAGNVANLASLYRIRGREAEAESLYQRALVALRARGNRQFESIVLGNLGELHLAQDRPEQAATELAAALAIQRESGLRRNEGFTLTTLALLLRKLGRLDAAREAGLRAIEVCAETRNPVSQIIALCDLATLELLCGNPEACADALDRADALATQPHTRRNRDEFATPVRLRLALARGEMAAAQARLAELQTLAADPGAEQEVRDAAQAAQAAMQAPLLWHGYAPDELRPELRAALLARAARPVEPQLARAMEPPRG